MPVGFLGRCRSPNSNNSNNASNVNNDGNLSNNNVNNDNNGVRPRLSFWKGYISWSSVGHAIWLVSERKGNGYPSRKCDEKAMDGRDFGKPPDFLPIIPWPFSMEERI